MKGAPFAAAPKVEFRNWTGRIDYGFVTCTRSKRFANSDTSKIPEFITDLIPDYMFSFYGQLRAFSIVHPRPVWPESRY